MAKTFKFDGLIKAAEKQKEAAEQKTKTSEVSVKQNIVIREEFKNLIPPLARDEFEKLKDNILAEGCRDNLIVWKDNQEYVLIDGHNRYQICAENNIDFNVEVKEFEGSEAVNDWMVNNQLGKRNVSEETKSYLRGLQYNREKGKVGGTGSNQYSEQKGQSVPTAQRLAEQHKVSDKTIRRDEKFAIAIDKISSDNRQVKWDILNKKINIPKTAITKYAEEGEWGNAQEIGLLLASGINFNQAVKEIKLKRQKLTPEDPHKVYLRNLKASIMNCVNEAVKSKSLEAIEELREYIDELENAIND
jgi:hypothetical protein